VRDRSYRPRAVKRVAIPKAGRYQKFRYPICRDRRGSAGTGAEDDTHLRTIVCDCSFGYRPGRSPHMAMRKVWREINEGNLWILDADLRSYFDK